MRARAIHYTPHQVLIAGAAGVVAFVCLRLGGAAAGVGFIGGLVFMFLMDLFIGD